MTDGDTANATPRVTRAALLVALGTSAISLLATVLSWVNNYVTEDQTLLWAAADSWRRLEPHQPNFWGQSYGTTLEAIPTAVLHTFGVDYATALPLAIAAFNLAMWLVLGLSLYRQARTVWVAVAFGALALLSSEHLVLATTYNTAAGRLLACMAAAVYLRWRSNPRALYAGIAMSSLALALETSTLLLAAPLAVYQVADWWSCHARRKPVAWLWLLATSVPALTWVGFTSWWYDRHPEDALHPVPALQPDRDRLLDSLREPDRHFGALAFELVPSALAPLAVIVVLAVLAVVARSLRRVSAMTALALALGLALASPKSIDYFDTPLFAAERIVLALAPALWFVAAVDPWRVPERIARWLPYGAWVIAGLCVVSTAWRAARWEDELGGQRDRAIAEWRYAVTPAIEIRETCAIASAAVRNAGITFAVFESRTAAYACAAQYPGLRTVYPPYDRRAWVLDEFLRAPDRTFLHVGHPPACPASIVCETIWPNATLVTRRADVPIDDAIWALGIPIRPPFEDYP